jgi:RNA polymerase sigma-70 factor (sigma-E family)
LVIRRLASARAFSADEPRCDRVVVSLYGEMRDAGVTVQEGVASIEPDEPSGGGLEDLYLRRAPEALRLAFLLTRDGQVAEDIVQEAFIRVAGRFQHLRSPDAFGAYLRRTVVNLCMTHHRRKRTARAHAQRAGAVAGRSEPSVGLPDIETRDEVRAALAQLPVRQRAAVMLRFYEDLPEQQVADALGCSVTAARSLVFRGMETLRTLIEREET